LRFFSDDDDIKGNFNFGAQFDWQITRNFALRTGASLETFFWHESTERYVNDGYYGYYEKDKETHSAEHLILSLTPALTFRPGIFNFTLYAGPYLGGSSGGGLVFGGDAGVKIGPGVVFTDMHIGFDIPTFDFFFNNGIGYRYGFVDSTSIKTDVLKNDDGTETTIVLHDDSWKNKWFSAGAWAGGGFGFNFGAFFDFQWFKYFAIRAGMSSEYVEWTVYSERYVNAGWYGGYYEYEREDNSGNKFTFFLAPVLMLRPGDAEISLYIGPSFSEKIAWLYGINVGHKIGNGVLFIDAHYGRFVEHNEDNNNYYSEDYDYFNVGLGYKYGFKDKKKK
jgi:hypothetical protein